MKKQEQVNRTISRDVLVLLAASFFYMASPMVITPFITGFSEQLGAGALIMGLVGGLTNLVALIMQPFSGNLADRMSKYRLGQIGISLLLAAGVGYVFAMNPAMIVLFRIVNGIGFSFCTVCFSTWLANSLPPDKVGFGMGLYGMMNAFAMAIAPALGVFVYQRFGYRPAFMIVVICAALCLLMIFLTKDKGIPIPRADSAKRMRLIDKKALPYAMVIMCFSIPYCATQSFIVRYTETKGLTVAVSMFFTIYAAALLVSRLILRNMFDRGAFKRFFIISSISAFLFMFFMNIMDNNLEMVLAAVFIACSYGIMCTVTQTEAIKNAGPGNRGVANGTYYIGLNTGMTVGPLLGGVLYGNLPITWFYPVLMIFIPICFLLYAVTSRIASGSGE